MIPRLARLIPLGLALVGPACSNESPSFDPATAYTPASLAQEFSFRYSTLPPRKAGDPPRPARIRPERTEARKNEAAKKAVGEGFDDLVDDIVRKAGTIQDPPQPAPRVQLADLIDDDPTILDDDKKAVGAALRQP